MTKTLGIVLHVIARQDDVTDTRSGDEVMNSLCADIEKALMSTPTRGGYAVDTHPISRIALEVERDVPTLETLLQFPVVYRHVYADPYTQT